MLHLQQLLLSLLSPLHLFLQPDLYISIIPCCSGNVDGSHDLIWHMDTTEHAKGSQGCSCQCFEMQHYVPHLPLPAKGQVTLTLNKAKLI